MPPRREKTAQTSELAKVFCFFSSEKKTLPHVLAEHRAPAQRATLPSPDIGMADAQNLAHTSPDGFFWEKSLVVLELEVNFLLITA
jgi:hypothetical protein